MKYYKFSVKELNLSKKIFLILTLLLFLNGCINETPDESRDIIRCSNYCKEKGMSYENVDSFTYGPDKCICIIHIDEIEEKGVVV